MKFIAPKRLAWFAVFACVGCCAFVAVLAILGVTSIVGLSLYFEIAALGFFIVSLSLFSYVIHKKKCSVNAVDGCCKPGKE